MRVPRYSEHGDWTVEFIALEDRAYNTVLIEGAELADLGFPLTFHNGP